MNRAKNIKSLLFVGILALLCLSGLQSQLRLVDIPILKGSYEETPDTEFSISDWFDGSFQEQKSAFINSQFGFRNVLVRLYNQIDYTFFKEVNVERATIGQDGFLYEIDYIRAALGLDFMGETNLKISAKKLGMVRDTLKSLGTDFIMVLAPSKGSYFPEHYPLTFKDSSKSQSNYELFGELLRNKQFNLFDANQWFRDAKDTTTVPLFSKNGIHWTKYGEYLVMDSLMQYIGKIRGVKLPKLVLDSLQDTSELYNTDDDIEKSLNLLFDIPDYENLIYPAFHFEGDSNTVRPKVVTIADSFYWGLHNSGMTDHAYDNGEFWYYFKEVYPNRSEGESSVAELNLKKELSQCDVVILLCTEINIYGFKFIETAYDAYFSGAESQLSAERINFFIRKIENDPAWYAKILAQADEMGITVEQCLRENAEYMVFQESME